MPTQPPPTNKGLRFPREALTEDEIRALLRAPSDRAPTGVRNRAMIALMYGAGLRLAEALDLKRADVDVDGNSVRVLDGKGHKPRTIGVDDAPLGYVARWVEVRRSLGLRSRFLFCTLDGKRMQPRYVRAMLQRMADRAGIEKRVHPHGLRHSFAATLNQERRPTNEIQNQLGHARLQTTAVYLGDIAPQERIANAKAWKRDL